MHRRGVLVGPVRSVPVPVPALEPAPVVAAVLDVVVAVVEMWV